MWVSRWNRVPTRSLSGLTFSAGKIFGRVHIHEAPWRAEWIARGIDDVHVEHVDYVLHALFALVPTRERGFKAGILAIDAAERLEPFARERQARSRDRRPPPRHSDCWLLQAR